MLPLPSSILSNNRLASLLSVLSTAGQRQITAMIFRNRRDSFKRFQTSFHFGLDIFREVEVPTGVSTVCVLMCGPPQQRHMSYRSASAGTCQERLTVGKTSLVTGPSMSKRLHRTTSPAVDRQHCNMRCCQDMWHARHSAQHADPQKQLAATAWRSNLTLARQNVFPRQRIYCRWTSLICVFI